jgi:16S rRNA (cytosine967-C5)-methyltransferase
MKPSGAQPDGSRRPGRGKPSRGPARGTVRRGPRHLALQVALLSQRRGVNADDALEELLSSGELTKRDRHLAEELVYGVIRHRTSLDLILAAVSSRPVEMIDPALREILRQAVYQSFFLTRIPDHAAVDEAVRLARAFGGDSGAAFVNAVLRAAMPLRAGRGFGRPAGAERRSAFSWRGGEHVRLSRALLPGPEGDPACWLGSYYSYPHWLIEQLSVEYGAERAEEILAWGNEVPPVTVRVNCLRTDLETLAARSPADLTAAGQIFSGCSSAAHGELPASYRLKIEIPLAELPGFQRGLFTVQDETQQRAAPWLAPRAGDEILDLCAAPGGKSTHLAELSANGARILACDADERRLGLLPKSATRLGLGGIATRAMACPPLPPELVRRFDKVLADVPCSNTGSMNRRVEARWRAKPESVAELVGRQRELLGAALAAAKPSGQVLYTTCSLLGAENGEVVRTLLSEHPEWRIAREETVLPHSGVRDGGYLALISPADSGRPAR